jgi:hypothetical protein
VEERDYCSEGKKANNKIGSVPKFFIPRIKKEE